MCTGLVTHSAPNLDSDSVLFCVLFAASGLTVPTVVVTLQTCRSDQFVNTITSKCDTCIEGYTPTSFGATTCVACAAGSEKPNPGLDACTTCGSGKISVIASPNCVYCGAGSIASADHLSCGVCSPGTRAADIQCLECGVGTQSPAGISCEACPLGRFSNQNATVTCTPCGTGNTTAGVGGTVCIECPTGRAGLNGQCVTCASNLVPNSDRSSCVSCPTGNRILDSACVQCVAGQASNDGVSCISCPIGSYTDAAARATCTQCGPGNTTFAIGSTSCLPCGTNMYGTNGQCSVCVGGTVSSNRQACLVCGPGNYLLNDVCTNCPAGTAGTDGKTCTNCPRGRFTATPGQSVCTNCGAGNTTYDVGQSGCESCAGNTRGVNGICTDCPMGELASSDHSNCAPCGPGTQVAGGRCENCAAGTFSASGVACLDCPIGKISAEAASGCQACNSGDTTYSARSATCAPCVGSAGQNGICDVCPEPTVPSADRTGCVACQRGYQYQAGSCVACQAGSISTDGITCTPCRLGTFSSISGLDLCDVCPDGTTSYSEGASQCAQCTTGSAGTGGKCSTCQTGTYATNSKTTCNKCGVGISCTNGIVSVVNGYWLSGGLAKFTPPINISDTEPTGPVEPVAEEGDLNAVPCPDGYCQTGATCGANRVPYENNPLCGKCLDGYSQWSDSCVECRSADIGLLIAFLAMGFAGTCVLYVTSNSNKAQTDASLQIFMYFIATSRFMTGNVGTFLGWTGLFEASPQSSFSACVFPITPANKVILDLVWPLALIGQLWLIAFFHWIISKRCCHPSPAAAAAEGAGYVVNRTGAMKPSTANHLGFKFDAYCRTCINALLSCYTTISLLAFGACKCSTHASVGPSLALFL